MLYADPSLRLRRPRYSDAALLLIQLLCMADALFIGYTTLNGQPGAEYVSAFLRLAAVMFTAAKFFWDRLHRASTAGFILAACCLVGISLVRSAYNHLFYLLIFTAAIWNADLEEVIKADFWGRAGLTLFIVSCSLLGVIGQLITYRTEVTDLRYSLGFNHPNTLAALVMSLTLEEAWLRQRNGGLLYTAVVWMLAAAVYGITLNRSAVLLMAVFPLLLPLVRIKRPVGKLQTALWTLFPLAVILFSVAVMLLLERFMLFRGVDMLLNGRFHNALRLYRQYGVSLLGQRVRLVSVQMAREQNLSLAVLDVAYLRTLIQAGPLVLAYYGLLYMHAFRKACRYQDRLTLLMLFLFMLFGLAESGFNHVFMNFTLFIALRVWYAQRWMQGE